MLYRIHQSSTHHLKLQKTTWTYPFRETELSQHHSPGNPLSSSVKILKIGRMRSTFISSHRARKWVLVRALEYPMGNLFLMETLSGVTVNVAMGLKLQLLSGHAQPRMGVEGPVHQIQQLTRWVPGRVLNMRLSTRSQYRTRTTIDPDW